MFGRAARPWFAAMIILLLGGCSHDTITDLPRPGNGPAAAVHGPDSGGVVTLQDLNSNPAGAVGSASADVAVTRFTGTPAMVHPGDDLILNAMVENLGELEAAGPFQVWIGVLGTNFVFGQVTLDGLKPGEGRSGTLHFTVPVGEFAKAYPSGVYTLYCSHNFIDQNPTNNYLLQDVELQGDAPLGDIQIRVSPTGLDAPWTLTGPDGVDTGHGSVLLNGMTPGDYTIAWGGVSGFLTPPEETGTLLEGQLLMFTGAYQTTTINDYMTLYFDAGGPEVPGQPCTTADFAENVTAYIVYMNPSLTSTTGFECGYDITSPSTTTFISPVYVTYPTMAVDVGTSDNLAGTYNHIVGFSSPLGITGNSFVLATLDILYLEMGTELDFTLRGSIPSSPPNDLPKVMREDFTLLPLALGMAPGSPTMVLNPAGDCPVIPIQ